MTDRPTLLLVHGGWHGAWCWEPLRGILTSRGWSVQAIDLPTVHAADKASLPMQADADAVARAIDLIDGDVVVVGHSYGGIPVTQGALSPKVRHIVYVSAFALDAGESFISAIGGAVPDRWHVEGGLAGPDEANPPRQLFYGDVAEDVAEASVARLLPQSMRAYTDVVTEVAWRRVPTTFVITELDRIVPVAAQEKLAARAGSRVRRLATSHSPFLSQPEALADIIEESADEVSRA